MVGIKQDHLIHWIQQGNTGTVKRAGRTRANDYLCIRIYLETVVVSHLPCNGLTQDGKPIKTRIGVKPRIHPLQNTLTNREWNLCIAYTLCKVNAVDPRTLKRHGTDSDWAIREALLLNESDMEVNYSAIAYHIILLNS